MLIRNAQIHGFGAGDLRIAGSRIASVGRLDPGPDEVVVDAAGGLLLPGLHDHHIHLNALAARAASVDCGPPRVTDLAGLAAALKRPGTGWLRGIGYHESVMGLPDARALDALVADRPVRIQHRSGRMWLLNSMALETVLSGTVPPAGLERADGRPTGRLFDADSWLRMALGSAPPNLANVSAQLAVCGVTGVTDMSPANDPAMAPHFDAERCSGALVQDIVLAGTLALSDAPQGAWRIGPAKLHLHESALPDFDEAAEFIRTAHGQNRAVAVHCVSEVELVFTLALFEAAGTRAGDRIEHASIAGPDHLAGIAALGLQVCVQPHFVAERGDRYLIDVEARLQGDLYRLATLAEAGIPLAGGSDAPFGSADPWAAMRAATTRLTTNGAVIGAAEALTPEAALALYLADPADLARQRRIEAGAAADLVLLDRPWEAARERFDADQVRLTIASGRIIHDAIHQSPLVGEGGGNPPA